jgi:hypothetical protein
MRTRGPELTFELLNRLPSDFISRLCEAWTYVSPRLNHGGKNFFFVIRVDNIHGEIPPDFPEFFVELLTAAAEAETRAENLVNDGEAIDWKYGPETISKTCFALRVWRQVFSRTILSPWRALLSSTRWVI